MNEKVEAILAVTGADKFFATFEKAAASVDKFSNTTEKSTGKLSGITSKIGGMVTAVGKIAAVVGIGKLISGAFNAISNSVSGAVDRVDTLNRFPLMMKSMGFSAEESESSINKLSDGIQGLPTSLDSVVSTAQQLAILTGDLGGATDTTLALNNAFIASGSSSADAERGLLQYTQMLSRGTVGMQEWRTLQETMGVALNDVAKAFGFAGSSAQNDLYDALQGGEITMDQFNNKLIELSNETGGFADRAKIASGGIKTSFQNIQTAVVRNVANMIQAVNDAMTAGGFGSISQNLDKVRLLVDKAFKAIIAYIPPVLNGLVGLYNTIKDSTAFQTFVEVVGLAIDKFKELVAAFLESQAFENAKNLLQQVAQAVLSIDFVKVIQEVGAFFDKWGALIAGLVAGIAVFQALSTIIPIVVGAFKAFMILRKLVTTVGLMQTAFTLLAPAIAAISWPVVAVAAVIGALVAIGIALWKNWDTIKAKATEIWGTISAYVSEKATQIGQFLSEAWAFVKDVTVAAWESIKTFFVETWAAILAGVSAGWSAVTTFFSNLWGTIKDGAAVGWAAITNFFVTTWTSIVNFMKPIFQSIADFLSMIWSGIQTAAAFVWNIIKNTLLVIIGIIYLGVMNIFERLKNMIMTAWTFISTITSNVWNAVSTVVISFATKIWTYVSSIFNTVATFVMGIWNTISSNIQLAWSRIVLGVTTSAMAVWSVVSSWFNQVWAVVVQVWTAISTTISNVWARIVDVVTTFATNVWNTIVRVFTQVSNTVSNVWMAISTTIRNVTRAAAEIVNSWVNKIRQVITNVFNAVKNFLMQVWTNISNIIQNAWSKIVSVATNAANKVKSMVTNAFNAIKSIASNVWSAISTTISNAWNRIKSIVTGAVNNVKTTFTNGFNSLRTAASNAFTRVSSAIKTGMRNAFNVIKGYYNTFKNAGSNLVGMIADGITGAIKKVTNAIGKVTDKIRNFLPFSPAKEGALSDLDKLNFGGTISEGIYSAQKTLQRAMDAVMPEPKVPDFTTGVHLANKGLENQIDYTVGKGDERRDPAYINLTIGGKSYRAFVENISDQQGDDIDLTEVF